MLGDPIANAAGLTPEIPKPTAADLESQEAGTFEEHWRKGIPTLILLLIAVFVSGYYLVLIRPQIRQRYLHVVESNLKRLQIEQDVAPELSGLTGGANASSSDLSPKERIEILKDSQLSLRRLVGWNPTDDSNHYRYGVVSQHLSQLYMSEALGNQSPDTNSLVAQNLGLAKTEYQNALGAMERVKRLGSVLAPKASLWLVHSKIENSIELTADELPKIEKTVRELTATDAIAPAANLSLAQILVERALRNSTGLESVKRIDLLGEADRCLKSISNNDVKALGLTAESASVRDLSQGKEYANQALQVFWSTRDNAAPSLESIVTAFRCLLIIDSFKEAQAILAEQLRSIPPNDQARFRSLASSAALRHLVANALRQSIPKAASVANIAVGPKGQKSSPNLDLVFSLAIQLNPESRELMGLLQAIAKPNEANDLHKRIIDNLMTEMAQSSSMKRQQLAEAGVDRFVAAVSSVGRGDFSASATGALVASIKMSPAYGVAISRLVVHMLDSNSLSSEAAIRWLATINSECPEVLVAWSDLANLYLKNKQPAEAIKCLEFLREKLPGNPQIVDALDAAKAQLKIRE